MDSIPVAGHVFKFLSQDRLQSGIIITRGTQDYIGLSLERSFEGNPGQP